MILARKNTSRQLKTAAKESWDNIMIPNKDHGRAETSTVTLNFVSNSEGSHDCE